MEGLNFDNIMDDDSIESLFGGDEEEETQNQEETEEENNEESAVEVNAETMFGEEEEENEEGREKQEPESVGSEKEENNTKKGKARSHSEASPNFFSSIAESMMEEGLFPDLSEEDIKKVKTAQDLRTMMENQMEARLTEEQKRIKDALDSGVEKDVVRQYESAIQYLSGITEEDLKREDDEGEELRKQLIFRDRLNKKFSKERAEKEVNRSVEAGTDVDDAKEALEDIKKFYQESYNTILAEKKKEAEENKKKVKERTEKIKTSILDTKNKFFDIDIDKTTRQKALDAISKPVFKDEETGQYLTELQKYQRDHQEEYAVKLGLLFAMTNGFKTIDKVVNNKVKKEVKKGFSELERKINNTSRDSYGNLNYMGNYGGDATFSDFQLDLS